jgi:hypothetical protein
MQRMRLSAPATKRLRLEYTLLLLLCVLVEFRHCSAPSVL